jgi:hypothetical protein
MAVQSISVPYCAIDDTEHVCAWDKYTLIDVAPGKHKIETFDRFKGMPLKRRGGQTDITINRGEHITITAQICQFQTAVLESSSVDRTSRPLENKLQTDSVGFQPGIRVAQHMLNASP